MMAAVSLFVLYAHFAFSCKSEIGGVSFEIFVAVWPDLADA